MTIYKYFYSYCIHNLFCGLNFSMSLLVTLKSNKSLEVQVQSLRNHFYDIYEVKVSLYSHYPLQSWKRKSQQHQISRGGNFNNLYLLTLFDCISRTFSYRVWGLGFWGLRFEFLKLKSKYLLILHEFLHPPDLKHVSMSNISSFIADMFLLFVRFIRQQRVDIKFNVIP